MRRTGEGEAGGDDNANERRVQLKEIQDDQKEREQYKAIEGVTR